MNAAAPTTLRAAIDAMSELYVSTSRGCSVWTGGGFRELQKSADALSFAAMFPSMGKIEPAARAAALALDGVLAKLPENAARRPAVEQARGLVDEVLKAFTPPAASAA